MGTVEAEPPSTLSAPFGARQPGPPSGSIKAATGLATMQEGRASCRQKHSLGLYCNVGTRRPTQPAALHDGSSGLGYRPWLVNNPQQAHRCCQSCGLLQTSWPQRPGSCWLLVMCIAILKHRAAA